MLPLKNICALTLHEYVVEHKLPRKTRDWLRINGSVLPQIGPTMEMYRIEYLQMGYETQNGDLHMGFQAGEYEWNLTSTGMMFPANPRREHASHERTKAELTSRQGVCQHFNERFANPYHSGCINLIWANLDFFCNTFFPPDPNANELYARHSAYVEVMVRCGPNHRKKPRAMDMVVERSDGALVVVEVGRRAPDRKNSHPKAPKLKHYQKGVEALGLGVPVHAVAAYYFEEPDKNRMNLAFLPV